MKMLKKQEAKKIIGKQWKSLSGKEQQMLSEKIWVDKDCLYNKKTGECTIDFMDTPLSIAGHKRVDSFEDEPKFEPLENATLYCSLGNLNCWYENI